jgi:hypothetical protein
MEQSTGTYGSFGIAASTFVDKRFMLGNGTASSQVTFQELVDLMHIQ